MPASVVLHQFPFSHFNEKARWGLAFKSIAHTKKNYLPGLHAKSIRSLSGQTATPVLELNGKTVAGSANILAALEEEVPEPALVPKDSEQAEQALELESRFDNELGPAIRAVSFSVLLNEGSYIPKMFASPQPLPKRWMYRAMFPLARGKVERGYKTNDEGYVAQCMACVDQTMDEIVERTQKTGYLVGEGFTVADLTAAALLAVAVNPDHPDMKRPEPQPRRLLESTERWRSHEAAEWVRRMYREFR